MKMGRIAKLVQEYKWLERIDCAYQDWVDMIKSGRYRVLALKVDESIALEINPHYPIPPQFIVDGISAAQGSCQERMSQILKELNAEKGGEQ